MEEKEIIKLKNKVKRQGRCLKEKDERIKKIENYFQLRNILLLGAVVIIPIILINIGIFLYDTSWLKEIFGYTWYLGFMFLSVFLVTEVYIKFHKYDWGTDYSKEDRYWVRAMTGVVFLIIYLVIIASAATVYGIKDLPEVYILPLFALLFSALLVVIVFFICSICFIGDD